MFAREETSLASVSYCISGVQSIDCT